MRRFGFIGILLGLASGALLVDVIIENGSTSDVSLAVFGQPIHPMPHWLFLVVVASLGIVGTALIYLGIRAVVRGGERRIRKSITQEVAEAQAKNDSLEAMRRVLTELTFELNTELENLQQKKLALISEINGMGINSDHTDDLTTPFRPAASRKRRAAKVVEAATLERPIAGNGFGPRRRTHGERVVIVPDLEPIDRDDPASNA